MNVIQDKVHPLVLPYYEEIKIEEDVFVAVITFPQGVFKPYILRNRGDEKILDQVLLFISKEPDEIDENFRRETEWFYPLDAIREVIINALAHRDWTRFVEIEVGIYSDRIEIISPGKL